MKEEGEKIQKKFGEKKRRETFGIGRESEGGIGTKDGRKKIGGRKIWWMEKQRERSEENAAFDFRKGKESGKRPRTLADARAQAAKSRGLGGGGGSTTSAVGGRD